MVSASDLLIGVETRSFDVVFFVRYQFWFANGTGYQYDCSHCSELSKSVQKVYELKLNYCKKLFFPHPFICQRRFSNEKVGN